MVIARLPYKVLYPDTEAEKIKGFKGGGREVGSNV